MRFVQINSGLLKIHQELASELKNRLATVPVNLMKRLKVTAVNDCHMRVLSRDAER